LRVTLTVEMMIEMMVASRVAWMVEMTFDNMVV
jgi:hypothetical protein